MTALTIKINNMYVAKWTLDGMTMTPMIANNELMINTAASAQNASVNIKSLNEKLTLETTVTSSNGLQVFNCKITSSNRQQYVIQPFLQKSEEVYLGVHVQVEENVGNEEHGSNYNWRIGQHAQHS